MSNDKAPTANRMLRASAVVGRAGGPACDQDFLGWSLHLLLTAVLACRHATRLSEKCKTERAKILHRCFMTSEHTLHFSLLQKLPE